VPKLSVPPNIRVTSAAHQLIQDLEQSFWRFAGTDPTDRNAVGDAYSALNQRRKDVYSYLSGLEREAHVVSTERVSLRFD
jgi:hypothetical protein